MEKEKTEKVKWKTFEFTFRRTVTEEAREGVRWINELQEERKRKREDDFRHEVRKMMKKGEETQVGKEEKLESLPTRDNQCERENRKCIERETAEGNNRDGGESKRDVQEAHTSRETKEERKDTEERTGLVTPSKILQVGGPEGGEIRPKGGEGSDDQELAKGRGPMELNEKGVFSEPMPLSTGLTPRPKNPGENMDRNTVNNKTGEKCNVKEKIRKIEKDGREGEVKLHKETRKDKERRIRNEKEKQKEIMEKWVKKGGGESNPN